MNKGDITNRRKKEEEVLPWNKHTFKVRPPLMGTI